MKMTQRGRKSVVMVAAGVLFLAGGLVLSQAQGVFNLSYLVLKGGYNLDLSNSLRYQEVKFSVDSDGTRYRVIQRISRAIENQDLSLRSEGSSFAF